MLATTRTTCADARHSPSLPLCVINTKKNGLQTMSLKKRMQTKKFLQMHFEFAYFSFFLIHLELRWQIRPYAPVVPSKTIPYCRNGWSVYPFSDQKGPKTILFRMAHIYMAYIREYRLPPPSPTRGGEKSEGFLICHEKGYRWRQLISRGLIHLCKEF